MPAMAVASPRAVRLVVLAAALGYFVDIFDLILFSALRVRSLQSLGVPEAWIGKRGYVDPVCWRELTPATKDADLYALGFSVTNYRGPVMKPP